MAASCESLTPIKALPGGGEPYGNLGMQFRELKPARLPAGTWSASPSEASLPSSETRPRAVTEGGQVYQLAIQRETDHRVQALRDGVQAVVEAMASEVQFLNKKEQAFADFRRGCRHCITLPGNLEAVEEKALVVEFLQRIAQRRATASQVKELAGLLADASASWRQILLQSKSPLRDLLDMCKFGPQDHQAAAAAPQQAPPLAVQAGSARTHQDSGSPQRLRLISRVMSGREGQKPQKPPAQIGEGRCTISKPTPSPPSADSRVFLREFRSKRYLTVAFASAVLDPVVAAQGVLADASARPEQPPEDQHRHCVMTELPASLFVCHRKDFASHTWTGDVAVAARWHRHHSIGHGGQEGTWSLWELQDQAQRGAEADDSQPSPSEEEADSRICGFAHEGIPEFGHFLAPKPWHRATLRDALTLGAGKGLPGDNRSKELCCMSPAFDKQEEFRWEQDGTIQHIASERWLYVDPDYPDKVYMHDSKKSAWQALPAQ
eukprot:TRINITY_DN92740_c0_g1_i1.p1 TRINITY_DN92740_c0_g1~~TRINITY_DN92740_c0_g1_i1.p1  ORF type:complete len:493 (+),score=79.01 TRINITY_DN92740_c0_g1_i1:92-1570(+)